MFECKICNYTTINRSHYEKHTNTKKHKSMCGINTHKGSNYYCNLCNYSTTLLSNYKKHISSKKHIIAVDVNKQIYSCNSCNITFNSFDIYKQHIDLCNKNIHNRLEEINNKLESNIMTKQEIETLIKNGVDNSNMAHNASRVMKNTSSLLKLLMTHYKDNPPLKELTYDDCKIAIKKTYNISSDKDSDKDNKEKDKNKYILEMSIIDDYSNKIFVDKMSEIILSVIKNDNKHKQSVYNTDINRLHYIIKKTISEWCEDKSGIEVNKLVIIPILDTIKTLIRDYRQYLLNQNEKLREKKLNKYDDNYDNYDNKYDDMLLERINLHILYSNSLLLDFKSFKFVNNISRKISPFLRLMKEEKLNNIDGKFDIDSGKTMLEEYEEYLAKNNLINVDISSDSENNNSDDDNN